jgi:hypothetical protein
MLTLEVKGISSKLITTTASEFGDSKGENFKPKIMKEL